MTPDSVLIRATDLLTFSLGPAVPMELGCYAILVRRQIIYDRAMHRRAFREMAHSSLGQRFLLNLCHR